MILEYTTDEGFIYAYITWNIIDWDNKLNENGKVVFIDGLWVHPNLRGINMLSRIIKDLFKHNTTQNTEYVLYSRDNNDKQRFYPISKFLNLMEINNV